MYLATRASPLPSRFRRSTLRVRMCPGPIQLPPVGDGRWSVSCLGLGSLLVWPHPSQKSRERRTTSLEIRFATVERALNYGQLFRSLSMRTDQLSSGAVIGRLKPWDVSRDRYCTPGDRPSSTISLNGMCEASSGTSRPHIPHSPRYIPPRGPIIFYLLRGQSPAPVLAQGIRPSRECSGLPSESAEDPIRCV